MNKTDIEKILQKRREVISKIEQAYNNILEPSTRAAGLQELEALRGHDSAIPFIIGYAHELEFDQTGHKEEAEKAIMAYQDAINQGCYDFLKKEVVRIKKEAGL